MIPQDVKVTMPRQAGQDVNARATMQRKFLRYLLFGGLAACIDLGGFLLLLFAGTPLAVSAATSFAVAVTINFRLTAAYVFSAQGDRRQFGMFLFFAIIGLALSSSTTVAGVQVVELPPAIAKLAGIAVAFAFNFSCNALIVFRPAQ
jgi:putative flippase GtrA